MNLREVHEKFADDVECLRYIEQMRWPDGIVRCPTCGTNEIKRYERPATEANKNKRGYFYICLEPTCRQQFSPTSGTLFHDSHLPLIVWFHAIALILNAKKGISAKQLQRDLGIGGYKTAWYLNHRIREAMAEGDLPLMGGTIEIDETYVGGKTIRRKDRGNRWNKPKDVVMGVVERGGKIKFRHVGKGTFAKKQHVQELVEAHVSPDVGRIMTDESPIYIYGLPSEHKGKHAIIVHAKEYVRGEVHTNTIESAFSLLKRGIIGSFHKVSIKHIQRYLDEFSYRHNRRHDGDAFIETVRRLCGVKPLPFAVLTSPKA